MQPFARVMGSLLALAALIGAGRAAEKPETPTDVIDTLLGRTWRKEGLEPSPRTSDAEFLRRVSLDLIGRVPSVAELHAFEQSRDADKRARLIDKLLESDEHARRWADFWTPLLLSRNGHPLAQQQLHAWLEKEFRNGINHKRMVEKLLTASGKSSDNGAVHFLASGLGQEIPESDRLKEGMHNMLPITARIGKLFLGCDFSCTCCHSHPFDPGLIQKQFWGVNAFLRQVEVKGSLRPGQPTGPEAVVELTDHADWNRSGRALYETIKKVVQGVRGQVLDGQMLDPRSVKLHRQQLAECLTAHPDFARAGVNRIWERLFGEGLFPVDDREHSQTPIYHVQKDALLGRLAKACADNGYDTRKLLRWICNSKAYQLRSVADRANETEDTSGFFSRMSLKQLGPEQLLESILAATQAEVGKSHVERARLRALWVKAMIVTDGDDPRGTCYSLDPVPEPGLQQLIQLMNEQKFQEMILGQSATLAQALRREKPELVMDELYLAALARRPTAKERRTINEELERFQKEGNKVQAVFWQDLFWALLNSSEFLYNH